MFRRPVLTTFLLSGAIVIAFGLFVDRRADFREARTEATFMPEGEIVTVDGRNVHVLVLGSGPDLVLIHGAGANIRDMTASVATELATRYRVFLVDRPGHGWTETAPEYAGIWGNDGEGPISQARLLSKAVATLGAQQPLVMGHSFGGAVAMAWGLEADASGLIIVSGVTLPWPGEVDITYRLLGSRLGGAILPALGSALVPEVYVERLLQSTFAPQQPPPNYLVRAGIPLAIRAGTLRANNRQVNTLRPKVVAQSIRYDEIEIPIEILHGTDDKTVFPEIHAIPLSERMENTKTTLIDGMGHMPHHTHPEDVIAAIDRAAERAGLR